MFSSSQSFETWSNQVTLKIKKKVSNSETLAKGAIGKNSDELIFYYLKKKNKLSDYIFGKFNFWSSISNTE